MPRPYRGTRPGDGARRAAATSFTAADVSATLDRLAPFRYAAPWDNVGLLAGRPDWSVHRGLVALDLTDDVAREVLRIRSDALVLYHPPILKGIRAVTPAAAAPTTLLPDLLAARVSIFAVHTALDAAVGGTNDALLDAFATTARWPLEPLVEPTRQYKLAVFVRPQEVDRLRRALAGAGAGAIGHYDECSFETAGRGTFRGDESTSPRIGRKLVLERADEIRLEMVVPHERVGEIVRTLYATHSYEEPAFDLYPLHVLPDRGRVGSGRVGRLRRPESGTALLKQLARRANLSCALVVGQLKRMFTSVTAAAGAFGVQAFKDPQSLVLTGEFKHHDALELKTRGVTAVMLGHYASERPGLNVLLAKLAAQLPGLRWAIARSDRPPLARYGI